jgi:glucose/arabinose dehydrogenase
MVARTTTPDVPFQAHSAALGLAFYRGEAFPPKYRRGAFVDAHRPATWGRPVGVLVLPDGSLLFTEEENQRLYRVAYRS